MEDAVARNLRIVVANHNLHSIYLYHHDKKFAEYCDSANYINVDGAPVVWIGRILGIPLRPKHRITFVDSFLRLMAHARLREWRVFFLGSKPNVARNGANLLRRCLPGLQIETHCGFFDHSPTSAENRAVVDCINGFRPNILMVGMGMPLQEHWILANREQLNVNVILNSGATMDYLAGEIPVPPRWAGPLGLNWLFRLFSEPRRLWKRYLVEPWYVAGLLFRRVATMMLARMTTNPTFSLPDPVQSGDASPLHSSLTPTISPNGGVEYLMQAEPDTNESRSAEHD